MPLHRDRLPVIGPCPSGVELAARGRGRAWCEQCSKPVLRLGEMTEPEVRALLAQHDGERICVEYRTRADGIIALRPEPASPRPLLAAALAGLAACTGHGEVSPSTWPEAESTRPFDLAYAPVVDAATAPVAPADVEALRIADEDTIEPGNASDADATADAPCDPHGQAADEADADEQDPRLVAGATVSRGAVLVQTHVATIEPQYRRSDRLEYVPTKTLWREFVERVRVRRAARVARRD